MRDETPREPIEFPDCTCGHSADEHHYSPSGCGTTHCEQGGVCECGHHEDDHGFPGCGVGCACAKPNIVVPRCSCREYEPDEPCANCGHLFTDHESTDLDCLALVHIPPYPERPCNCAKFLNEWEAEEQAAKDWLNSQGALG